MPVMTTPARMSSRISGVALGPAAAVDAAAGEARSRRADAVGNARRRRVMRRSVPGAACRILAAALASASRRFGGRDLDRARLALAPPQEPLRIPGAAGRGALPAGRQ